MNMAMTQDLPCMLLDAGADFSYSVFGWTVTTPPPSPSGDGIFAQSPTTPALLQNASSQLVPPQSIAFNTANPSRTALFSMPLYNGFAPSTGFWNLQSGGSANFALQLAEATNVTLTVTCAGVANPNTTGSQSYISVSVNGQQVASNQFVANQNWHDETFVLDAAKMVQGENTIVISDSGQQGLWITAVGVSTADVPISASYFWQQIGAGELNPGNTYNRSIAVTSGNTSTDTETDSFAETLGLTVGIGGGGIDKALFGISAQLSTSFTHTSTTAHSLAISQQTTSSYGVNITPPGADKVTFQIWQLCLQYEANDTLLTQALGPNDGPIVITQYPA